MFTALVWRIDYAREEWPPRIARAIRHPMWDDAPLGWLFGKSECHAGGYIGDWFTHADCGCPYDGWDYSRFRWWTWALYDLVLSPAKWLHLKAWRTEWYRGRGGWAR